MVRAVRSPGSTLKPFIYGLGFQSGIIHPETLIADRPGPVNGYAPGNFDHTYRGEIRVREALRSSRNLPAVKLLERVDPPALVRTLERGGIRLRLPDNVRRPGLPIALGGAGLALEDLVRLYGALADGGRMRPLRVADDDGSDEPVTLLSPVAAWYLTDILADSPLPAGFVPGERRVAFKTGTSYGFRDAWAIGYDAGYTAGVWIGRPDGGYTAGLSGLNSAVPVLMELFDLLPAVGVAPLLRERPAGVLLAANDELPPALRRFDLGVERPGMPASPGDGLRILYPGDGSLVELAADADGIVLVEARGGEPPFHWLVDGRYLSSSGAPSRFEWQPHREGEARITLIDRRGRADSVRVEVKML
jgi:penicillin-binding protein 1C